MQHKARFFSCSLAILSNRRSVMFVRLPHARNFPFQYCVYLFPRRS